MTGKARPAGLLTLTAAFLLLVFSAPAALGDTGDIVEPQHEPPTAADGFQAGTCYENQLAEDPTKSDQTKPYCSADTPSLWFTQAGGHPPFAFDQYIVRHKEEVSPFGILMPLEEPLEDRVLKTERVDLPPGFTENPQSSPKCSQADFKKEVAPGTFVPACDPSTIVGRDEVWLVVNTPGVVPAPSPPFPPGTFLPKGFVIPPDATKGTRVPVYNLVPHEGEPARLGFVVAGTRVIELEGGVAWESDFHEYFTVHLPPPSVPFSTLKSRLVAYGQSGDGTHVTLPTTCFNKDEWPHLYSTWFRGESWGEQNPTFPEGSTPWEAKQPPGVQINGCERVPFEPSIDVAPGTSAVDSPAKATVTTHLPFVPAKEGGEVRPDGEGGWDGISQSHVRRAFISLPKGMGLNPSGAPGLLACTDAQFKKGVRTYTNECPAASDIGTVEVDAPPLAEPLKGDVYVGTQKSRDPESGEEFRILLEAKSEHEGIATRLIANVKADRNTGDLTAVITDRLTGEFAGALPEGLPQVPFESIRVSFDGSNAVLTSPPICSAQSKSQLEPWARPGTFAEPVSTVTLATNPSGGACPKTLADRPFDPGFNAGPTKSKAGAFTPFELHLTRPDGAQEFRQVNVKLPKGMVAQLRNLDYCPEKTIDNAERQSGAETVQGPPPSCPDKSFLGTAKIAAGSGPQPYVAGGNVYLAGPYKGAPVSLVFITPAVAGPFDLGTVVVRVAIEVDPETVQVTAVSDTIPYVFGGVKLDIRRIDVSIYRKPFTLNPTSCKKSKVEGTIAGGGGNPNDPAAWSKIQKSTPFKAKKCGALKFKPRLDARIFGGPQQAQRTANPKFRVILWGHYGDANIKRASFILPASTILDQAHIRTICTRVQLAADSCPKGSIYGYARARSPLLSDVVKGPVYLTSSKHELPDLLADLHGQIDVRLRGVISSVDGRLKTVFPRVPDVPVRKFVLAMKGGNRGLLVVSQNLCDGPQFAKLNLKAHNGKQKKANRLRMRIDPCS